MAAITTNSNICITGCVATSTSRYDELGRLLDDAGDHAQATDRVRRLMFLEKLLYEIDDALASLEE
jgi:molecular chaperone HscB